MRCRGMRWPELRVTLLGRQALHLGDVMLGVLGFCRNELLLCGLAISAAVVTRIWLASRVLGGFWLRLRCFVGIEFCGADC